MRSGGWERSARDARSVPLVDSGSSIAGPGGERAAGASSRRWSTPASGRPRRSASLPSTRPTATSPSDSTGSRCRTRPTTDEAARAGARRRCPRGHPLPRQRLLDLAPARLGRRRSRSSSASSAARCRCPRRTCRWSLPRDLQPTGEGNPLAERPDFVDVECPQVRRRRQARDRHPRLPLRRPLALGPGRGPARRPRRADVHPPRPAEVAALRAAGRRQRQRRLRLRPARSSPRRCATSAPSRSWRRASPSPAASSTRW